MDISYFNNFIYNSITPFRNKEHSFLAVFIYFKWAYISAIRIETVVLYGIKNNNIEYPLTPTSLYKMIWVCADMVKYRQISNA